ncbi:hypothetical protein LOTGIDRAFT_175413 [Lottia gigantea]|uniref:PDZ domain-containing protein n=1 Tax=Lottia gigantea TaxID=225164 RepID=V3ZT44_LOTGI|nr:hypothetical protein LOTGIDRAFT_175413 [Lottia gigantea]ESO94618.1 hypothetical protein LOTGIDRAFT_175413 [Lottia gigantea]
MVLPPYEPPPPYVPPSQRLDHPDYIGNVKDFLPRRVTMVRTHLTEPLGFNIRGGKEHYCGIYVSKVMPGSEAARLGVKEADQILSVNETDFQEIEHSEAVKVLKMNTTTEMILRFFPYGYSETCVFNI